MTYDGLEDENTEVTNPDECMYCGGGSSRFNILTTCNSCETRSICNECLESRYDDWFYEYATDTGSTAICPVCLEQ